ncbi:2-isopropylmalate synthase [Flavobacteriaceae bacterium]|jgi:D-citramalate synthase|nr:2-isopropylmalate synthase [Flavobacteriaceae bacterium]MDA7567494.1 2-isopropylmalate synthase [Flavobacteriaceae bacterium]MDA9176791.1 2-isopropylmalate synthase [Flavobacteriaceae bacterium]MDB2648190.1 2-isopropylmalate synthase [Flavobacteriaceae bacterium]MDB4602058.1 2-isopropylmalate synthase [Flavobacteriaceae bacterium]
MVRHVEIMDTTLRDGEQTSGMSFTSSEKLAIAKLLIEELKIDRIEVASARVSKGEFEAVRKITGWAKEKKFLNKIEILTFLDNNISLEWLIRSGARVQNLLTKGSLNHLTHQIKQSPKDYFNSVIKAVNEANNKGVVTNIYLEDWSNGMRNSKDFVFEYLDIINKLTVKRVLLPDTLGILSPDETFEYISIIVKRYPEMHFDFHAHNDYDLSVSNVLEGLKAGCQGLHLTVNGMGERAGNAPMASVAAVIRDFLPDIKINLKEKSLFKVSRLVSAFTGFRIPANKPIVGDNVFTQTAGIHADGDSKKNLYFNDLLPERFGRKRKYALGKTSGKANIKKNLQELGLTLNDENIKKVTNRIIELGDKKEKVTAEDLPYIISDVINSENFKNKVIIESYLLNHKKGHKPSAEIELKINGKKFFEKGSGDGQFDAFINAIKKIYSHNKFILPELIDYSVTIPPGSNSDALCETIITWKNNDKEFVTRGLDSDQTVSAIKSTEKMLNIISN